MEYVVSTTVIDLITQNFLTVILVLIHSENKLVHFPVLLNSVENTS